MGPDTSIDAREPGSSEFRFKTGELLVAAPNVPLKDYFRDFSETVLDRTDKGVVLVAGPSGVGKTELLLGRDLRNNLTTGGLPEAVARQGRRSHFIDLQQFDIGGFLGAYSQPELLSPSRAERLKRLKESEVVLFDEGIMLVDRPQFVQGVKEIMQDGKRIVVVGGGTASSQEQLDVLSRALEATGIVVASENRLAIPYHIMTAEQVYELVLGSGIKPIDPALARASVAKLDAEGIPRIFRAVWRMAGVDDKTLRENIEYCNGRRFEPFIYHIQGFGDRHH